MKESDSFERQSYDIGFKDGENKIRGRVKLGVCIVIIIQALRLILDNE